MDYKLLFTHVLPSSYRGNYIHKLTESAVNCLTSKRVIAIQRLDYECYLLADKLLKYASPHETFKGGHPKIFFPQNPKNVRPNFNTVSKMWSHPAAHSQ